MAQFPLIDQASLVMIPGAYKEGKIYSQLPTDGSGDFTYTRGTDTATRVNENGLIEKERANLLLQSNSFDLWNIENVTSGHAGYDGTNDAWLQSGTSRLQKSNSLGASVYTGSVYVKAGFSNYVQLYIVGSSNALARFELTGNGTIVFSGGISPRIEPVSGATGWYRISTNVNASIDTFRIYPINDSSGTQTADSSIYIQDAQVEQGLVATDYIETTTVPVYAGLTDNMPRLDYTDATCPSLLLEPQRTNELQHSEYVLDWAQNTADITLSDNLSPEGYKNCWRVEWTASGAQVGKATFNIIQGATYTTSIWIRKVSGSDTAIFKDVNNNSNTIDITTEWKRHTLTSTTSSTTARLYVSVQNVGDVIEVYGAQLEEGSYATSYIPTYGSSVTRIAESALRSTLNLSKSDFTLFVEFEFNGVKSGDEQRFYLSDGTSGDSAILGIRDGSRVQITRERDGVLLFNDVLSSQFSAGNNYKYLGKWKSGDNKSFLNGVQKTSNTITYSDFAVDITHFNLTGSQPDGAMLDYGLKVKQVLYFPTALTDTECIALTTI